MTQHTDYLAVKSASFGGENSGGVAHLGAFERELVGLFDPLASYFYRRLGNMEDAADAASETIEILLRKQRSLPKGLSDLRPYAFGIARNVLAHAHRHGFRASAATVKLQVEHRRNEGTAVSPEEMVSLKLALERLTSKEQEIVTLVAWEGFTLIEVARIIGLSESATRKRYSRARKRLKALLEI